MAPPLRPFDEDPFSMANIKVTAEYLARQSGAICGCCGSVDAKLVPIEPDVDGDWYYCRDHYVNCLHTPWFGPNGEDWDSDEPECLAAVKRLEAEWDAL